MVWVRTAVLIPKSTSTPAQRAAAFALAGSALAGLPGLLHTQLDRVADTAVPARWQTFGIFTTIWDTQAHANNAHTALLTTRTNPIFKAAIRRVRTVPPFQA